MSSLHDTVYSSAQILDKRVCIEIAILRDILNKGEITKITLVDQQITDSLKKTRILSFIILGTCLNQKELCKIKMSCIAEFQLKRKS